MPVDTGLQRIYDRIELVPGLGDPGKGKLCIMSFVALLSGERHMDTPQTASPLIREFAVPINDAMPSAARQRLKPFAPRILDTNDGRDDERALILYDVIRDEIVPRLWRDFGHTRWYRLWHLGLVRQGVFAPVAGEADLKSRVEREMEAALLGRRHTMAALTAARLVISGARSATEPSTADWYWTKAVEILDRLCEVGAAERASDLPAARLREAEAVLGRDRDKPLDMPVPAV